MKLKKINKQLFLQSFQFCLYYTHLTLKRIQNFFLHVFFIHKSRYMLSSFIVILSGFTIALGILLGVFSFKIKNLSDIEPLNNYALYEIPSVLYDVNGKPFKKFTTNQRIITPYKDIPKTVINTLILAEDRNFWNHRGVNPLGIVRAMIINIIAGHVKQGGSTLTQQLAKLIFTDRKRNITRKVKELFYAFQIEKKFTKEEILEKYLNKVYYANGIYSIASATQFYFNIPLKQVNYAQAALLISIPPSPTYYNPLTHPINVQKRQKVLMNILVDQGKISKKEAEYEMSQVWKTIQHNLLNGNYYNKRHYFKDLAPYFSEYIRRILYKKFGSSIYKEGYKIYTTLDLDLQQQAQKSIHTHLKEAQDNLKKANQWYYKYIQNNTSINNLGNTYLSEFLALSMGASHLQFHLGSLKREVHKDLFKGDIYGLNLVLKTFGMQVPAFLVNKSIVNNTNNQLLSSPLQSALVATEVKTGRILSMIGGNYFSSSNQLNRAYQARRQPGSTFKPFLYLAAINSGRFTAATTFEDRPIGFSLPNGKIWLPGNSASRYNGSLTLRNALKKSVNIISISLLNAFTIPQAISFISQFLSVDPKRFQPNSSLALGTNELTPLELNKGYAILANGGQDVIPHAIIQVRNRYNQIVYAPEQKILSTPKKHLDDPRYNYIIIDIMKDVIQTGTGAVTARNLNFQPKNLTGKTGTTSNMTDAWFSGFSPDVATTVWIGFDRRTTLGLNAFGGVLAEPIWIEYMKQVYKKYPYSVFKRPYGLVKKTIHRENGLLMPDNCLDSPLATTELFTQETVPEKYSPYCFSKIEYNIEKNKSNLDNINIFN